IQLTSVCLWKTCICYQATLNNERTQKGNEQGKWIGGNRETTKIYKEFHECLRQATTQGVEQEPLAGLTTCTSRGTKIFNFLFGCCGESWEFPGLGGRIERDVDHICGLLQSWRFNT
ncbi:hypothetical protein L9F63_002780, partial [Diploptera punctata]